MTGRKRDSLRRGASAGLAKGTPLLVHRQSEIVRFARSAIAPASTMPDYSGARSPVALQSLRAMLAVRVIADRRLQTPNTMSWRSERVLSPLPALLFERDHWIFPYHEK
jgi:hypothetical protein